MKRNIHAITKPATSGAQCMYAIAAIADAAYETAMRRFPAWRVR